MQLILLETVRNLGSLGDNVKVKAGYGRNFLVPQGKAVPATKDNRAHFEQRRAELEKAQGDKLAVAKTRSEQLTDVGISIARKVGNENHLFGSVNAQDIAEALTTAGIEIARKEVRLPDGPLRSLGEFQVTLHLHADVEINVTIYVVAEE
jgi:large subunit ribosomal protein L9